MTDLERAQMKLIEAMQERIKELEKESTNKIQFALTQD